MKCHGKLLRWSPLEHFQLCHISSIWSFKDSKLILLLSRSRNTSPNHLRLLHLIKQASMSSESRKITVLPCIFRVGSKRKCGASRIHSLTVHLRCNLCCSSYPKPSKVPQVAFPQQSQLNLTLQVAKDDMLQQALLGIASKNAAKGCHYATGDMFECNTSQLTQTTYSWTQDLRFVPLIFLRFLWIVKAIPVKSGLTE